MFWKLWFSISSEQRAKKVVQKNPSSSEVLDKEDKFVSHYSKTIPVALVRGQGVYLWDMEEKRYFDFLSGCASVNIGHCHPKLIQAIYQQSQQLHQVSVHFHTNVLAEYSEKMCKKFGYDKILPTNTGVEAADVSCKLARKWGYRKKKIPKNAAKIICAKDNFWGRSLAAISASTDPSAYEELGPHMPGFHCIPFNDLQALEEELQDPNVCAFMVECLQGDAGIVVPTDGYLKGVRELCTKYNVLWIADEIQTGMGRTGKLLACQYENVKPDILVLGKGLGGGIYPVSATLANDDVMLVLEPGTHGTTYGGNPIACTVAMTVMNILEEEDLVNNSFRMGEIFRNGLEELRSHKAVLDIRGKGLLNGIELNTDVLSAWGFMMGLKERGLLAKDFHGKVIRFAPPLTINKQQILESVEIIKRTIYDLTK